MLRQAARTWCPRVGRCLANAFSICCAAKQRKIETNGGAAMPYGGNDWLALTQEPTLEPELPDLRSASSLLGFSSRAHPLPALSAARAGRPMCGCGHNVRSTVFIEATRHVPGRWTGGDAPGWRGRVRPGAGRRQRQRALRPVPGGRGDHRPCRPEAGRPGRAGVGGAAGGQPQPVSRHPPHGAPGTRIRELDSREQEGVLATAEFRAGAQVLARKGLSLDTGVCFPQLPELAAFARAVPDLTDHPEPSRRPDPHRPLRRP